LPALLKTAINDNPGIDPIIRLLDSKLSKDKSTDLKSFGGNANSELPFLFRKRDKGRTIRKIKIREEFQYRIVSKCNPESFTKWIKDLREYRLK
jgi:hypothetical protein